MNTFLNDKISYQRQIKLSDIHTIFDIVTYIHSVINNFWI
jgi:hypothetical protein